MDQLPNSSFAGRFSDGARTSGMHSIEFLRASWCQHTDEIDHDVSALGRARHRVRIAKVSLDAVDLADSAHRLQMPNQIGTADRRPDPAPGFRQRPHCVTSDKAGATIDSHQLATACHRIHPVIAYQRLATRNSWSDPYTTQDQAGKRSVGPMMPQAVNVETRVRAS
jgi:hypothetical protein